VFACRLAEKACQLGHRVHLLTASDAETQRLDELLWSFRAESFLPHQSLPLEAESDNTAAGKLTLGTLDQLPPHPEVLVNLSGSVWEQHRHFADIREIVSSDEPGRNLGRQRYRFYQEQGYTLETMQL